MYPPAKFSSPDIDQAFEIARRTKFACLAFKREEEVEIVHLPLTVCDVRGDTGFVGHVVKNNPLLKAIDTDSLAVKVVFQPANGYVGPSVYPEKLDSGKVVPTWNYVAAHFKGVAQLSEPDLSLRQVLDLQVSDYEAATGGTWEVADAPEDYIAQMQNAITGIQIQVQEGKAIRKLSQNKQIKDLAAITEWLATTSLPSAEIAQWMRWQND